MQKFLFYNKFIIFLHIFRVQKCSKHVEKYNKLIIKQEFVHEVGQLLRLASVKFFKYTQPTHPCIHPLIHRPCIIPQAVNTV